MNSIIGCKNNVSNKFIEDFKPNTVVMLGKPYTAGSSVYRRLVARWIFKFCLSDVDDWCPGEPIKILIPFLALLRVRENDARIEPRFEAFLRVGSGRWDRFDATGRRIWREIAGPTATYEVLDPTDSENAYRWDEGDSAWHLRNRIEPCSLFELARLRSD